MSSSGRLLTLLCTAQVVDVLDVNAVLVALPVIGRDLGLRGGDLQWVVTAYVLVFAGCLLVAGRLADALGRRRVFTAGLALFTVASLACGLAPGAGPLVAARAAQGLGAALTAPAALAMVVDAFPAGRPRDRAVAVWTGVAAAGGAAGLVLGGLIASGPGWRWIFLVNVPIGVVALLATPRVAPADGAPSGAGTREGAPGGLRRATAALDVPGAVAATAGLALLVLGVAERGTLRVVALAGAAVACSALVVRERRAADPLLPPRLLSDRRLLVALAAAAVLTATTSGGGVLATLHLQDVLGLTPAEAGLALLPLSGAVVAGSILAGRLGTPAPAVMGAGVALVAAGSAVAAFALARPGLVAWAVLAGAGLGAASVAATALGTTAAGEDGRGTAAGLLSTAAQVGTALGVAALVLVADGPGTRAGFAAAAALALVGLAAPVLGRDR